MEPQVGTALGLGILLALVIAAFICSIGYARKRQAAEAAARARAKARARAGAKRNKAHFRSMSGPARHLSAQQQALLARKLRNEQEHNGYFYFAGRRYFYWEFCDRYWDMMERDAALYYLPDNDFYCVLDDDN